MHPLVRREEIRFLEDAERNGAFLVILDVPLLFESGLLRFLFCLVVVVATNPDVQFQRLRQRNTDLSQDDCRNRIASQYPMQRKVDGADLVIWNNGSVNDLEKRVKQVKAIVKHRLHGGIPMYALVFVVGMVRLLVKV